MRIGFCISLALALFACGSSSEKKAPEDSPQPSVASSVVPSPTPNTARQIDAAPADPRFRRLADEAKRLLTEMAEAAAEAKGDCVAAAGNLNAVLEKNETFLAEVKEIEKDPELDAAFLSAHEHELMLPAMQLMRALQGCERDEGVRRAIEPLLL